MTITQSKEKERRVITANLLGRFKNGKILSAGELYDRILLERQLEALLQTPLNGFWKR